MSLQDQGRQLLGCMSASELSKFAADVALAVGMTPGVDVQIPDTGDGSWVPCYRRGIERLSRPVNLA